MQPCGQLINLAEGQDHEKNQYPQCNQPDKGKTKVLEVEKYDAPKEIEGQLNQEEHQTACPVIGCRSQINPRCANSHQGKQNAPDNWKHDTGWRQWRLLDGCVVDFRSFPCQPARKAANRFRENNPESIDFPCCFLHALSPKNRICRAGNKLFQSISPPKSRACSHDLRNGCSILSMDCAAFSFRAM